VNILDPLSNTSERVKEVTVIKRFVSKAQPLLLELTYESGKTRKIICKKGDDLRQDFYILTLFNTFNEIWRIGHRKGENSGRKLPLLYSYGCVPLSDRFGLIEYVENCLPASSFRWEKYYHSSKRS